VWDVDLYSAAASDIKNMKCEMTIFDGEMVYKAAGTPITVQNK
jgi:predicted amidohydrolase YtcJ